MASHLRCILDHAELLEIRIKRFQIISRSKYSNQPIAMVSWNPLAFILQRPCPIPRLLPRHNIFQKHLQRRFRHRFVSGICPGHLHNFQTQQSRKVIKQQVHQTHEDNILSKALLRTKLCHFLSIRYRLYSMYIAIH
jgi:hypothetical protein